MKFSDVLIKLVQRQWISYITDLNENLGVQVQDVTNGQ